MVRRGRLLVFVEVKFRADRDARASRFVARFPHHAGLVWQFDLLVVSGKGGFR